MKVLLSILFTCLFLLIGVGLQFGVYAFFNAGAILNFETFTIIAYILQGLYCTALICVGILTGIMAGDDNIAM